LSYVSIGKAVNDKIVHAARGSKDEIVGLLLGRLEGSTLVIENSITGESSAAPHRVSLSSSALAKIADGLVTGLIKGNIVGWYHSHTAGGLFFSETDIATQRNLQQFSRLIVGMVVDTLTGEVGFFRVEPQMGQAVRIPAEKIRVHSGKYQATFPKIKVEPSPVMREAGVTNSPVAKPFRYLTMCGIIVPFSYFLGRFTAAFFFPGYNPLTELMSALGATGAPYVSAIIANIVGAALTGLLIVLFAIGFFFGMESSTIAKLVPALLLTVAGISMIIASSVYHCDPGCVNTSPGGLNHMLFGEYVFGLSIGFTPLAAAYALITDNRWNWSYCVYSLAVTPTFLLLTFLAPVVFGGWAGLLQIIEVLFVFLWLVIVAARLLVFERATAKAT
jgi:proteasome lid subunit RPN8/RPN11